MEAAQLSIQKFLKTITEEEEREVQQQGQVEEQNDEEFYEEIEAPKFVDFTASDDPFRPDDCYWFCLRVGCDRKHEEELDPEEISKNFVLRVMAARSPNVRLRRALNGRNLSSMKCPLSAPAKSSRSRLPRLAMVSSMSQKMLDVKEKVGTHPKTNSCSTPMVKGKQVASKYMTTPRNKRNLSHQTSFRSVQNPRPTKIAVPKSLLVAKALVFRSPKKTTETAVELHTPLTKLCEGMKRLEITSQRKRVLGYTGKSAKGTKCTQSSISTESSRKKRTIQDGKCLPLCHRKCKGKEVKSLKADKTKSNKQILTEPFEKVSEAGSRKEGTDAKLKDGSTVSEGNAHDEALKMAKNSSNTIINSAGNEINSLSSLDMKVESALCHAIAAERNEHKKHLNPGVSEEVSVSKVLLPSGKNSDLLAGNGVGDICSLPNLEGVDVPTSHALVEKGIEGNDIIKGEDCTKVSSENELKHGDDKENGQAPDENRAVNCNNNHSKKKLLGRKQTHENDKKVVREVKDGFSTTTTAAPDLKNRKPKPTNPKPFRLRTDERGILKEANMEKKLHHPQNQAAVVSSFRSGNSQRRRGGNDTKENEKCSVQSNGSSNTECVDKESVKEVQQEAAAKLSRTSRLQTIREQACRTPQRRLNSVQKIPSHTTSSKSDINDNENKKPGDCKREPQSPSLGQVTRPQGKVMNSSKLQGNGLCVIKETLKAKSTGKQYQSGVASYTKSTTSAAFRSASRVPIFHTVSVSKNQGCAKNIV